jgi:putative glutathione S-transferase
MGRLIDGDWHADVSNEVWADLDHEPTEFRSEIGTDAHPADPGRYHLYVSWACPWAHGTLLTRALLGLDDEIGISVVDPHRRDDGWAFTPEKDGCTPDRIHGSDYLREVYAAADPDYTGRVSVPVLWDREVGTVVNEESDEIMRTLAANFGGADGSGGGGSGDAAVDLYPEGRREEIDETVEELYGPVNRGVYRAGFADTQADYEAAVADVFDALDRWEDVLAEQRFLLGDLTLADLRLFATLVRFDSVYHTHFKMNRRRIVDYSNLWGFTRDVYQLPGVAETVNLDHVKEHYYRSHTDLNPTRFVPVGPDLDFEAPHDRAELPGEGPRTVA